VQAHATPECKALELAFLEWVKKDRKQPPPKPQDTTTKKRKAEEPPLYADIDSGNSDDEGGNQKVAAAVLPQPKEDNDDEYEDDYEEEEEEEALFQGKFLDYHHPIYTNMFPQKNNVILYPITCNSIKQTTRLPLLFCGIIVK
jgi:hypothetical protein